MFSNIVKHRLIDLDMSRADLASALGVSVSNLNQNLRNDNFRISTMISIAEALDCDLNISLTDRVGNGKIYS